MAKRPSSVVPLRVLLVRHFDPLPNKKAIRRSFSSNRFFFFSLIYNAFKVIHIAHKIGDREIILLPRRAIKIGLESSCAAAPPSRPSNLFATREILFSATGWNQEGSIEGFQRLYPKKNTL